MYNCVGKSSERNTKLKKKELLSWFGSISTYLEYHQREPGDLEEYYME